MNLSKGICFLPALREGGYLDRGALLMTVLVRPRALLGHVPTSKFCNIRKDEGERPWVLQLIGASHCLKHLVGTLAPHTHGGTLVASLVHCGKPSRMGLEVLHLWKLLCGTADAEAEGVPHARVFGRTGPRGQCLPRQQHCGFHQDHRLPLIAFQRQGSPSWR